MERFDQQQKKLKIGFPIVFSNLVRKGLGFFFFMLERKFFHQTPCIYILNSRGGRQTYYFDFIHLSEQASLREGPASQPQSTLSCSKKNIPLLIKDSDPPQTWSQKNRVDHIFQNCLTVDVKIVWFGRQVAVCSQKRHKNAIFGCSWFQKFNFDCFLLKLLICSPTTENIFNFFVSFVDS